MNTDSENIIKKNNWIPFFCGITLSQARHGVLYGRIRQLAEKTEV